MKFRNHRIYFRLLGQKHYVGLVLGIALSVLNSISHAAPQELDTLSLEQLLGVEVTSAARKEQSLGEVAGAIFVISAEDIRRSGVTSVAEALRMVPGVHVGRIDDTRWAVTARGFNDQLSNKLLVMMDGRHIYTPDFAGVFWSDHMPLIDNVERIEVIRGPGATIWGSNAVNGVINIISRSARDTQGLLIQARGGTRDMVGMTMRYGDVTDSGWFYRMDFHSVEENLTDSPLDAGNADFLEHQRASFRIDGSPADSQFLRFEGSFYQGDSKEVVQTQTFPDGTLMLAPSMHSVASDGAWLMADWRLEDSESSHWNVSSYIEHKARDFSLGEFTQSTFSF
ncbi:MAG: TonB-dependent receptor plug domain-containing protein [Pseudomonadales bacterium]|nr:TonB-dependent receptor plug domain-containing protein [Pseudomonadales bacterium]